MTIIKLICDKKEVQSNMDELRKIFDINVKHRSTTLKGRVKIEMLVTIKGNNK